MTDSSCAEVDELLASRRKGVERLAALPPAQAVPRLVRRLSDWGVQPRAAELLRTGCGNDGHAALKRALDADGEWVRLMAACSLAHEQDPQAFEVLKAALKGSDLDQWAPALGALELFGAAARPILERELTDEQEGPPFLREMAASSLAIVAGQEARPVLEVAAGSSNKSVRSAAQRALAQLDAELASG
jgi:hypothetical protein